jgi:hypothetical protein
MLDAMILGRKKLKRSERGTLAAQMVSKTESRRACSFNHLVGAASSVGGTSRPSALAVLRLTASRGQPSRREPRSHSGLRRSPRHAD